jgi:hypothetical protein
LFPYLISPTLAALSLFLPDLTKLPGKIIRLHLLALTGIVIPDAARRQCEALPVENPATQV